MWLLGSLVHRSLPLLIAQALRHAHVKTVLFRRVKSLPKAGDVVLYL